MYEVFHVQEAHPILKNKIEIEIEIDNTPTKKAAESTAAFNINRLKVKY